MVPKQITRLLKRVSLLLGELAVFPLGFFLSYKLGKGFALDIPAGYGSQESEARIAFV